MAGAVSSSIHSSRVPEASRKPLEFSELSNEIRKAVFVSSCGTKNETEASIYQSFFFQSLCLNWSLSTLTLFYQAYMSAFRLTIPIIGADLLLNTNTMDVPISHNATSTIRRMLRSLDPDISFSLRLSLSECFQNIRIRKCMYLKDEDRSLVVA